MNQQLIDQLVKLATIRVNNPLLNSDDKVVLDDSEEGVSMSKLIELAVRECLGVVENLSPGYKDYRNQIEDSFRGDCMEEIKQHFGVK